MFKPVTLKSGRYLLVLALLMSLAVSFTPGAAYASADKATVCHKPGTSAEKTLEVSESAVSAHLGHGDRTGACGTQVSTGCAAVNALVPDAQTNPAFYTFGVTMLDFLPGEVLHADLTIQPLSYSEGTGGAAALAAVKNSTGLQLASEIVDSTPDLEAVTASVTYVVVANDDADGLLVATDPDSESTFSVVSVHFSCTPAG